jgi:hypothetical protein
MNQIERILKREAVRKERIRAKLERHRAEMVWILAAPLGEGLWCGPYPVREALTTAEVLGGRAIRPVHAMDEDADRLLDQVGECDSVMVEEHDLEIGGLLHADRVWRGMLLETYSIAGFAACPDVEPDRLYRLLAGWLGGGLCGDGS